MRKPRRLYDKDSTEIFTVKKKKCDDRVISGYAPPCFSSLYFGFD